MGVSWAEFSDARSKNGDPLRRDGVTLGFPIPLIPLTETSADLAPFPPPPMTPVFPTGPSLHHIRYHQQLQMCMACSEMSFSTGGVFDPLGPSPPLGCFRSCPPSTTREGGGSGHPPAPSLRSRKTPSTALRGGSGKPSPPPFGPTASLSFLSQCATMGSAPIYRCVHMGGGASFLSAPIQSTQNAMHGNSL